jgi:hypothetical protein
MKPEGRRRWTIRQRIGQRATGSIREKVPSR